jgi:hypothetical protein
MVHMIQYQNQTEWNQGDTLHRVAPPVKEDYNQGVFTDITRSKGPSTEGGMM